MSEPTLVDALAMVSDLHRHRAINAGHAVEILAAVAHITLYRAASLVREFERQEYGEPADQWTPEADDWRGPLRRGDDGEWTS